jgi:hypothetical protein
MEPEKCAEWIWFYKKQLPSPLFTDMRVALDPPEELTGPDALERAAAYWDEICLPKFKVNGYLDGIWATWDVAEVLRLAASRIKNKE